MLWAAYIEPMSEPSSSPSWPAEEERYQYIRDVLARECPPPRRLLELGAAPGALTLSLSRQGYDVTAVDLGEALDGWGDQAEGAMTSAFTERGIQLLARDLESVPYPFDDETFDVVLLTEVIEHLRDYPARVVGEARRLLKPGGLLLITTPNAAAIQRRVDLLFGRTVYTPLRDWIGGLPHARHAREYTVTELKSLISHAGFDDISVEGRHFHLQSGRRSPPIRFLKRSTDLLGRLRPTLGPNLAVIARTRPGALGAGPNDAGADS